MRLLALALLTVTALAQEKPRARELGVPFTGQPGRWNAITDVSGVEVGHATVISGEGEQAVRDGVTIVWPRGHKSDDPAFGAWYAQNGNGEMTGTAWLEESGFLDSPVMITNTQSVGTIRDAFIKWQLDNKRPSQTDSFSPFSLPIVAETLDDYLTNVKLGRVSGEQLVHAIDTAASGPVAEGNVGGGTGMICYGFKGGIGTSSRKVGDYTIGVLVQCNCGRRNQLMIGGVPVGREIPGPELSRNQPGMTEDIGSIIIVVATDAPLIPTQLKRLTHRATMGLARTGSSSGNGSGDLFIAFSTANAHAGGTPAVQHISMLPNDQMNPLFEATVNATEEAIVNALVGAETMTGYQGRSVPALPHDRLRQILSKYNRLENR